MKTNPSLKRTAISLRKRGKTYNEILTVVPVAKSTLSLWLRSVGLSNAQQQRITRLKQNAQRKGARVRKEQRLKRTREVVSAARADIGQLTARERFLIGVALYWAEGSKEHEGSTVSQPVDFGNTDPGMIRCYISFLRESLSVPLSRFVFSIYIHESHRGRIEEVKRYWRKALGLSKMKISWVYYKKHNPRTVRKNVGSSYVGTLRIYVRNSSTLQRKISGWIYGIKDANWDIV